MNVLLLWSVSPSFLLSLIFEILIMWIRTFPIRIVRIDRGFYLSQRILLFSSFMTLRISILQSYLITGIDKALVSSFGNVKKHRFVRYVNRNFCLLVCTDISLKSLLNSLNLLMSKNPFSIILVIDHFPSHISQLSHCLHRSKIKLTLLRKFCLTFP